MSDVETLKHGANRINNNQGKGNKRLQLHIENLLFTNTHNYYLNNMTKLLRTMKMILKAITSNEELKKKIFK